MYRKLLSFFLCIALVFTYSEVAFSNTTTEQTNADGESITDSYGLINEGIVLKTMNGSETGDAKDDNPEIVISGDCGDSATYVFYKNGQLVISGQGAIYDYNLNSPWYQYRDNVKEIIINEGITRIGNNNFIGSRYVTSVILPDTLIEIGNSAFGGCWRLAAINIPSGVNSIGNSAFEGCALEEITLPEGIAIINSRLLVGCNVTKISLPNSVTVISQQAFAGTPLEYIILPNCLTYINYSAFENCNSLKAIIFNGTKEEWNSIQGVTLIENPVIYLGYTLTLQKSSAFIGVGDEYTIAYSIDYAPDEIGDITWSSSDESVAMVSDSGVVTGLKAGTASIVLYDTAGQEKGRFILYVLDVPDSITIEKGSSQNINIHPDAEIQISVSMTSSNINIFTVDENGFISGVNTGIGALTISAEDFEKTCQVKVVISPESINLNASDIILERGESVVLPAVTFEPENTTETDVTWISSDERVFIIENGTISAIGPGNAVLTAICCGCEATANVKVIVTPQSISFTNPVEKIEKGQSYTLLVSFDPIDATETDVTWDSSDSSILTVDESGNIQAIEVGEATITAFDGSLYVSSKIAVVISLTEIEFSDSFISIPVGTTLPSPDIIFTPEDTTEREITWISSDNEIVAVDSDGNLTALQPGNAEITATVGEHSAKLNVKAVIYPESIAFKEDSITLIEGQTIITPDILFTPENATEKDIEWDCSDNDIITIDNNGNITALQAGTAVITAMAGDCSTTCYVRVIDKIEAFVTRLYNVCLGREPDEGGLNDWVSKLRSKEQTGAIVARNFIFSTEFKNKNYCNTCFVKQLYKAFMNREYDQGGLDYWVGKLEGGWKRQQVFNGFTQSAEFKLLCQDYGIERGAKVPIPTVENAIQNDVCSGCGASAPAKYTISYVLNNGTQNKNNRTWYTVQSADFNLEAPTRTGYTFNGWYSDSAFTNNVTAVPNGSTGNKTFYAKWTANQYTIKFAGNGSTSGTMSNKTGCKYGNSYTLTANAYKKTGYTFNGWNSKADGSGTTYKDKASVKNLSAKNGATVTLYAQWKVNTYTIKFAGNGSTSGTMSNKTGCKYGTSYTLTANAFKRTGYTFNGWNTKADGSGTAYKDKASVKNLTVTNGATVTLYAQWKSNYYTLKYAGNGSTSGSMSSKANCKYGTSYTLTANAYKRTGYDFNGWNTKADGSGTAYKDKATVSFSSSSGSTITLYAQWKPHTYTIKFAGNGSTSGSMSNKTGCKYGTSYTLTANAFKKTGYEFKGWNTKADGSGTTYKDKASVKNLSATNGATVTLYAQWKKLPDFSQVSYYTNEGLVVILTNNTSKTYDVDITFLYYKAGVLVKKAYDNNYGFEGGRTCAVRGWVFDVDYDSCELILDYSEMTGGVTNASKISVKSNYGSNNVMATVTNNGKKVESTIIAIVFYKNNKVIGYNYTYADVNNPGDIDYLEFSWPYDSNYNYIKPDSYKIYVNHSIGY